MKKVLLLLVMLIPLLAQCSRETENDALSEIRSIAWNSLDENARATVNRDWQKAPVTETVYNELRAWVVVFHTKDDSLLGPITVYVDPATHTVVGQGLRM